MKRTPGGRWSYDHWFRRPRHTRVPPNFRSVRLVVRALLRGAGVGRSGRLNRGLWSVLSIAECEAVAFVLLIAGFLVSECGQSGGIVPDLLFLAVMAFIADLLVG